MKSAGKVTTTNYLTVSGSNEEGECAICLEPVVDSSSTTVGHDAVFCDGVCQKWLHRTCAGLSVSAFEVVSKSRDKFLCYQCCVGAQRAELKKLHESITLLKDEVTHLKGLTSPLPVNLQTRTSKSYAGAVSRNLPQPGSNNNSLGEQSLVSNNRGERKFNLIVYGVSECPKRTLDMSVLVKMKIVSHIKQQIPSFDSITSEIAFSWENVKVLVRGVDPVPSWPN